MNINLNHDGYIETDKTFNVENLKNLYSKLNEISNNIKKLTQDEHLDHYQKGQEYHKNINILNEILQNFEVIKELVYNE